MNEFFRQNTFRKIPQFHYLMDLEFILTNKYNFCYESLACVSEINENYLYAVFLSEISYLKADLRP